MNILETYFIQIIGIILLFLMIIYFLQYRGVSADRQPKRVQKIVTIETFPDSESSEGLCKQHLRNPFNIHQQCKTFNEKNCNSISCCVWLNGQNINDGNGKCVGGDENGPFYLTENREPIGMDSFSHLNVCTGQCLGK